MAGKENSPFDPENICQVGIVVKNIDETVKFYSESLRHRALRYL